MWGSGVCPAASGITARSNTASKSHEVTPGALTAAREVVTTGNGAEEGVRGPLVPANPFLPAGAFPPKLSPLQHPDPHDPNPTFPKLCTLVTGALSHQEEGAEGCAHISPARSHRSRDPPIAELGLKERFSVIFWEPLPSPPLLQTSFLSLGLFSLLPHKGLTLACFEWTRRQH